MQSSYFYLSKIIICLHTRKQIFLSQTNNFYTIIWFLFLIIIIIIIIINNNNHLFVHSYKVSIISLWYK